MTNKLVVIINSLKVPKIRNILLYEMKFLVPNYSCLQIRGLPPPDLRSICHLSSTEFFEPPPRKKFLGTPLPYGALLKKCSVSTAFHCMSLVVNTGEPLQVPLADFP